MVKNNGKNTEIYIHSNGVCHCRGLKDFFCYVESVNIEMFENTESETLNNVLLKFETNNDTLVAFSS